MIPTPPGHRPFIEPGALYIPAMGAEPFSSDASTELSGKLNFDMRTLKGAQFDRYGDLVPILANVVAVMRAAPELKGVFSYDQMARSAILTAPLPAPGVLGEGDVFAGPRPIRDVDSSQLQAALQRSGLTKIGREPVIQAIELVARERSFHPVQQLS
jgi:hypothetical protein